MVRYIIALFLICFLVVGAPCFAQSDDSAPIGTIAEMEGAVTLNGTGKTASGTDIHLNDILETGMGAKVMITFIDDTELTLGENAHLTVDEYVFDDEDDSSNKGHFSILRGAFIFTSGLIGKRENPDVQIKTSYGAIGLRGTTVWGGLIDNEYNVFVQDGEISFATGRGRVTVRKGEGTKVANNRAIPTHANIWAPEKIDHAVKMIALKNPEKARARIAEIKKRQPEMRDRYKKAFQKRTQEQHNRQIENGNTRRMDRIKKRPEQPPVQKDRANLNGPDNKLQENRPHQKTPFGPERRKADKAQ